MCDQTLAQPQLPEDVHGDVHGGVVSDGEGAQVQDATQAQRGGAVGVLSRSVLSEQDLRGADDALLTLPGVI